MSEKRFETTFALREPARGYRRSRAGRSVVPHGPGRRRPADTGRGDILFFLICTIVGVDTIASVASSGGEAFTWMLLLAVLFFVPQALLFAELGTTFPEEGGPYLWTRMAFGHLAGAVNNFLYWVTNPVWLGGTLAISAVTALQVFFHDGNAFG